MFCRVENRKSRGKEDGAGADDSSLFLLLKVNRMAGAEFFTGSALSFLKVDAVVSVDHILERNCLSIFHVRGFAVVQSFIEFIGNFFRAFFRTGPAGDTTIHVHGTGMGEDFHAEVAFLSLNGCDLG
jgi:hypothetical protein